MTGSFSVVVPLYEKRDFVRRTIESILAQTMPPREVIVIDDGSTDGGADTIADLAGNRLRIVRQDNAGVGAARNRGIAEARGDWVALVDADDLWDPSHLATLAAVAQRYPQADLVSTGFARWSEGAIPPQPGDSHQRLFDLFTDPRTDLLSASSVALRRTAFLATTGFGSFPMGEDTEFWVRFALDHFFARDDHITALYRSNTGGMMDRAQGDEVDALPAVFTTIQAALATSIHADRHDALRGYADRIRTVYARNLLYLGRGPAMRGMCAGLHRRSVMSRTYVALSFLPPAVLRGAARLYSALKHR